MIQIAVINPNATSSMTDAIAEAARSAASPGTTIRAYGNGDGPVVIEGHVDGALAVPGMLRRIVEAEAGGAAAHVIACFDDTGLEAARSLANKPVLGIGEAAAKAASFIARRFTVVTTLSRSIPILEDNLARYGLAVSACVRASEIPVLMLEADPDAALQRISQEIELALSEDRAEAIVLGCAGMADFAGKLSLRHEVPVIDGVATAVRLAEALAGLGLHTSKRGGYATPARTPSGGPQHRGAT